MRLGNLLIQPLRLLFCCFYVLSVMVIPSDAYAVYEGVRSTDFDSSRYMCDLGTIDFDPLSFNKDVNWEITNPTCAAFMVASGALIMGTGYATKGLCIPTNPAGAASAPAEEASEAAQTPQTPTVTPKTAAYIATRIYRCGKRTSEYSTLQAAAVSACATVPVPVGCAPAQAAAALALTDMTRCCAAVALYTAAVGAAIAALAIIYDTSRITYENARICGHDWQRWAKNEDGTWIRGKGPYRECVENLFLGTGASTNFCKNYSATEGDVGDILAGAAADAMGSVADTGVDAVNTMTFNYAGVNQTTVFDDNGGIGDNSSDYVMDVKNKYFREFIYGGKEFRDNKDGSCKNPWGHDDRMKYLGYDDDYQRYYMTGAAGASVYACQRFLSREINEETQSAYDCCKRRSQNTICIENRAGLGEILGPYSHSFCEAGSKCSVGNVAFEIYTSQSQSNYVCAKTYSVCPYNHLLGGGTETQKIDDVTDEGAPATVENFCQYMNHCAKVPILPYIRSSSMEGAFISASCKDMKGDSQNVYGYTSQLVPINTRGFTAPMAQCFKETMENIFLNKAGDSKCIDPNETPDRNAVCVSGYIYQKGKDVGTKSFFIKIQDNLQDVIKMGLVISIMMFGYGILMGVPGSAITKKQLMPYVLKIGLVMYFAVGDGWQNGFMTGILNTSALLSEMTFRVDDVGLASSQLDGCQFPRFNYADENEATKYNNPSYSTSNQYLRIWDTLDCKIARALGFGPEVSVPNLILMILGGFLTGGLGIIFVIASFFLAFLLLSVAVKALHIFLISVTSMIILMYVSPITISLAMFNKHKPIFDKWWKQLLGFTMQPMILFCYLGILISLFDKVIIGDVTFVGDGKKAPKQIICSGESKNTSIYCIFRIADMKTFTGLEPLGIGLPMLTTMNKAKMESIIKAGLLLFIFSKFMDQITKFATALVGGAELSSSWGMSAGDMAKKAYGAMRAVQKRGMGAIKQGGKAARGGIKAMKSEATKSVNKGKAVEGGGGEAKRKDTVAEGGGGGDDEGKKDTVTEGGNNTPEKPKEDSVKEGGKGADSTKASKKPELDAIEEGDEEEEEEGGGEDETQARPDAVAEGKGGSDEVENSDKGKTDEVPAEKDKPNDEVVTEKPVEKEDAPPPPQSSTGSSGGGGNENIPPPPSGDKGGGDNNAAAENGNSEVLPPPEDKPKEESVEKPQEEEQQQQPPQEENNSPPPPDDSSGGGSSNESVSESEENDKSDTDSEENDKSDTDSEDNNSEDNNSDADSKVSELSDDNSSVTNKESNDDTSSVDSSVSESTSQTSTQSTSSAAPKKKKKKKESKPHISVAERSTEASKGHERGKHQSTDSGPQFTSYNMDTKNVKASSGKPSSPPPSPRGGAPKKK